MNLFYLYRAMKAIEYMFVGTIHVLIPTICFVSGGCCLRSDFIRNVNTSRMCSVHHLTADMNVMLAQRRPSIPGGHHH